MKNRGIILIVVLLIVVLGGLAYVSFFNNDTDNKDLEQLLQINTTIAYDDNDLELYEEAKVALAEDENSYSGLLNLAMLKQRMLDYEGALELYSGLSERKPDDIMPLQNSGSIYFDTGEYEMAEKVQLQILNDITYKWINSYRELMMIYRYHLKDKRLSMKPLLEYAYENYPEARSEITSLLAQYYDLFEDNKAEALKYYNELLVFFPTDPAILLRIEELKQK